MKKLILVFLCIIAFSISNAQDNNLKGDWNIIEFQKIINNENSETTTEDQLREEGAIWDLFFMEDSSFKQTSNMLGNGTTNSQEGQWKTLENNLMISIQIGGSNFDLNYSYDLQENVLVLTRTNPNGTMKVVAKFKKK